MGFACYACRQPVEITASRCPHCTSELSWAGAPPAAYKQYKGSQLSPEQEAQVAGEAIAFSLKFAFWLGMIMWFWDELKAAFIWVYQLQMAAKEIIRPWVYTVLGWIF
jgi:hypothetical protein